MILMKTKANGQSARNIYTLEMRDTAVEVTTLRRADRGHCGRSHARRGYSVALAGWRIQQRESNWPLRSRKRRTRRIPLDVSAEQLASSTNEIAASITQVTGQRAKKRRRQSRRRPRRSSKWGRHPKRNRHGAGDGEFIAGNDHRDQRDSELDQRRGARYGATRGFGYRDCEVH